MNKVGDIPEISLNEIYAQELEHNARLKRGAERITIQTSVGRNCSECAKPGVQHVEYQRGSETLVVERCRACGVETAERLNGAPDTPIRAYVPGK